MRLAFQLIPIAICAIPLGAWAGASLYSATPRTDGVAPVAAVERSHKGSLLVRPFGRTGAEIPVVEVEVNGRLDAAITLRDRDGQVLYRADPVSRVTTVAKRAPARVVPAPPAVEPVSTPAPESAMPDGCEGAFSPYAAPRMAHVIGRCIS